MNELREKSWVKVDLPSTLVNMGCLPNIIPRIIPIRYEKETSDQMRNVNLSNDESQQDEAVKVRIFSEGHKNLSHLPLIQVIIFEIDCAIVEQTG